MNEDQIKKNQQAMALIASWGKEKPTEQDIKDFQDFCDTVDLERAASGQRLLYHNEPLMVSGGRKQIFEFTKVDDLESRGINV